MKEKRRLILTNVNASVFMPRYCTTFLSELIVNALMYEEVLIREGDLIGNRKLLEYLREESNFQIFTELLSVGAIKVLQQDPNSYRSNLTQDPFRHPISARAEDQELNRSFSGRPWRREDWEKKLFDRLDKVVTSSPQSQCRQQDFPKKNEFATELLKILNDPEGYNLSRNPLFQGINRSMVRKFRSFCDPETPEAWEEFVRIKGKKPLAPGRGFYRTQAYQCAELFGEKAAEAMQRLIESIYAANECFRENADGRYGRSALAEKPTKCDDYDEAYHKLIKIETLPVIPKEQPLKLAVAPGIGEVLAELRGSEKGAFKDLQECLRLIGTQSWPKGVYVDQQAAFNNAWSALCSAYETAWIKYIPRTDKLDRAFGYIACSIYMIEPIIVGIVVNSLSPELQHLVKSFQKFKDILDHFTGEWVLPRIEHWSTGLSRLVRALPKMPAAHKEMLSTVTLRCHSVAPDPELK